MKRTWNNIRPTKRERKAMAVAEILQILDDYNQDEIVAGRRHPATSCNDYIDSLEYYCDEYRNGMIFDLGGYAGDIVADVLGCF